jgi:hypothetical protein
MITNKPMWKIMGTKIMKIEKGQKNMVLEEEIG